jgi:hypothetical protein
MIVNQDQYQEILSDDLEKGINPLLKVRHVKGEMRRFFLEYMDFIFLYAEKVQLERVLEDENEQVVYLVSPSTFSASEDSEIYEVEDSFRIYQEIKSQTF